MYGVVPEQQLILEEQAEYMNDEEYGEEYE